MTAAPSSFQLRGTLGALLLTAQNASSTRQIQQNGFCGGGSNLLSLRTCNRAPALACNRAMRETGDGESSLSVYIRECLGQDFTKVKQKPTEKGKGASQWRVGHLSIRVKSDLISDLKAGHE